MAWAKAEVGRTEHPFYGKIEGFARDKAVFKTIADQQIWEPELVELFGRHISPGSVALDCGANIGAHSIAMCKAQPRVKQVVSIEPHPDIFPLLSINVAPLKQISTINAGVSNAAGAMFTRPIGDSENPGGALLFDADSQSPLDETRPVNVITLDSLRLEDVSLLKIDVEGHEERVIEGARQLLEKQRPTLIVEIWDLEDLPLRDRKIRDICALGYVPTPITAIDILFVDDRL